MYTTTVIEPNLVSRAIAAYRRRYRIAYGISLSGAPEPSTHKSYVSGDIVTLKNRREVLAVYIAGPVRSSYRRGEKRKTQLGVSVNENRLGLETTSITKRSVNL